MQRSNSPRLDRHSLLGTLLLATGFQYAFAAERTADAGKERTPQELKAAADAGDAEAMFEYGKVCWHGRGVAADPGKAVEYYRKAAEKNQPDALAALGAAYGLGQGVEKRDEHLAAEYYREAAELGSAFGKLNLGSALLAGNGVEKNTEQGLRWATEAAEQGLLQAQVFLAELYTTSSPTRPLDYEKAILWARKAAERDDARALNLYGVMLRDGLATKSDPAAAIPYFVRAADGGLLKAYVNLGSAYFFGQGVEVHKIKGMTWWFAGEQLGDGGCRETASRLIRGVDPQDVAKARKLALDLARERMPALVRIRARDF